jgi:hypothetical protein
MTDVSPTGLITFVSQAYGGRASDKAIFEQSNLIQKLDIFSDHVMVDKGFLIDTSCEEHGITLVRPPFLKNKTQFTENEALNNVSVARARVHVERVNQRIKVFKILNNTLPSGLIQIIDDIVIVICAIVNLASPVLADDKFSTN